MTPDWIKDAKVGDKVVCIDDRRFSDVISAGKEYTLRLIYEDEGQIYLALVGVAEGLREPGFLPSRFRPVEPRKSDISIFTDMLKKASKPVEECV